MSTDDFKRWEPMPGYTPPRQDRPDLDQAITDHETQHSKWCVRLDTAVTVVGSVLAVAGFMFIILYGLTGA